MPNFGLAVQGPGDLGSMAAVGTPSTTQDGAVDLFVNAALFDLPGLPNAAEGRSYAFSGRDVNGDGYPDLYGNGFNTDAGTNDNQGRAWVFDGQDSIGPTANPVLRLRRRWSAHQCDHGRHPQGGRGGAGLVQPPAWPTTSTTARPTDLTGRRRRHPRPLRAWVPARGPVLQPAASSRRSRQASSHASSWRDDSPSLA